MKEKEALGDTVQKFRDFYTAFKNQRGEEALRRHLAAERELSLSIPNPVERGMFQALIADMEVELLGKVSDETLRLLGKVMDEGQVRSMDEPETIDATVIGTTIIKALGYLQKSKVAAA